MPSATVPTEFSFELRSGLGADEVEQRLHRSRRAGDLGARVLAFYLADMRDRGLHLELGFATVEQFARARLGMQPSTTREHIAAGKALEELPVTDRSFADGALWWSQVRALVRVAVPETETAWVHWARDRSVREVTRQAGKREKGQLPTDPCKRRIHTPQVTVAAKMTALERELWSNARAKLEAEAGGPIGDTEILLTAARLVLGTRVDGTVVGRTPLNDSHYRVALAHCEECCTTQLRGEEEDAVLEDEAAHAALREAGHGELATGTEGPELDHEERHDRELGDRELDVRSLGDRESDHPPRPFVGEILASSRDSDDAEENDGPAVPDELRDAPTSNSMRQEILARDRWRCSCCRSKANLTVHHKRWRRLGGRTIPANMLTLCEGCHSLVHARLLVVQGSVPDRLLFLDRRGRELRGRIVAPGARGPGDGSARAPRVSLGTAQRAAHVARATTVRFGDLPPEVGPAWWAQHLHLFSWNDKQATLEFEPGVARAPWIRRPMPENPRPGASRTSEPGTGSHGHGDPGSGGCPAAGATRPRRLADVIGQQRVVTHLARAIEAARRTGRTLGPVLLSGPPGLGKTSLARATARELGTRLHTTSGPLVTEPVVILRLLTGLQPGDVLFLDEIHRLPPRVAEVLYEAMEDACLSLSVRCGMNQRTLRVRLGRFTIIGATTEDQLLPEALRARFSLRERLEFYEPAELGEIVERAAARHGLTIQHEAAQLLARVSRDTPREALALLGSVRDEAIVAGATRIDAALVSCTLARLGIDEHGLRPTERCYLRALRDAGRPLGLATLAGRLASSVATLQQVVEPYLLRRGLIRVTPGGREVA